MCADLSQDKCGELSHLASPDGGGGREREGTPWGKGNACGGHDFYSSSRGPQDKPHFLIYPSRKSWVKRNFGVNK